MAKGRSPRHRVNTILFESESVVDRSFARKADEPRVKATTPWGLVGKFPHHGVNGDDSGKNTRSKRVIPVDRSKGSSTVALSGSPEGAFFYFRFTTVLLTDAPIV